MLVPGIFLTGGTFKSLELNVFPKLELLKTLPLFSRPWGSYINQCEAAVCITNA